MCNRNVFCVWNLLRERHAFYVGSGVTFELFLRRRAVGKHNIIKHQRAMYRRTESLLCVPFVSPFIFTQARCRFCDWYSVSGAASYALQENLAVSIFRPVFIHPGAVKYTGCVMGLSAMQWLISWPPDACSARASCRRVGAKKSCIYGGFLNVMANASLRYD